MCHVGEGHDASRANVLNYSVGESALWHCPLCVGFHVGWVLMLLSPFTELFSFNISLGNGFILSCISAGTSYLISVLVDDFGLRLSSRSGGEYVDD